MAVYTVEIPDFLPTPLNRLLGSHWAVAAKMKKKDAEIIGWYVRLHEIPKATGPRKVSLRFILPRKKRAFDPDAAWKVLLDSLTACGALVDDNRQHVQLGEIRFHRGEEAHTIVTLEDLA